MNSDIIKYWIGQYIRTGRIAIYHPKLNRIALNGGRSIPVSEAIQKIKECLKK